MTLKESEYMGRLSVHLQSALAERGEEVAVLRATAAEAVLPEAGADEQLWQQEPQMPQPEMKGRWRDISGELCLCLNSLSVITTRSVL